MGGCFHGGRCSPCGIRECHGHIAPYHRCAAFEYWHFPPYHLTPPARTACRNRALVGSLYWRWGFNVYANDLPGPYGEL